MADIRAKIFRRVEFVLRKQRISEQLPCINPCDFHGRSAVRCLFIYSVGYRPAPLEQNSPAPGT